MTISRISIENAISVERFAPYLAETSGNVDQAWSNYRHNLKVVSVVMPLISDVEVTLRNTIHAQLTNCYGTHWWTSHKLLLDDATREMLSVVVKKNRKKLKNGSEGPGRVVADVTFGVWVNLLSRGSVTELGRKVEYDQNVWRRALMNGFQVGQEINARGLPKRPIRRHVHERASNLQRLRNAASHHRDIRSGIRPAGAAPDVPRIPLSTVVNDGIELLGWMSPELADTHLKDTAMVESLADIRDRTRSE